MHSLFRHVSNSTGRLGRMCSHMTSTSNSAELPYREIRIPVPWGHIAAKEWGEPQPGHFPILALHGWQDNCCSFDPLIRLLRPRAHVVAFDLPGHGLSSFQPQGMNYYMFNWLIAARRIVKHLKWEELNLVAHSFSMGIALAYASSYPDTVRKLVALDALLPPFIYPDDGISEHLSLSIDALLNCEQRMTRPPPAPIPRADAIEKSIKVRSGAITERSAQILLERAVPTADGERVTIHVDPRLKIPVVAGFSLAQLVSMARNVACDMLLVSSDEPESFTAVPPEIVAQIQAVLEKRSTPGVFKQVKVGGTHHVHLNEPEKVAPHINAFLEP